MVVIVDRSHRESAAEVTSWCFDAFDVEAEREPFYSRFVLFASGRVPRVQFVFQGVSLTSAQRLHALTADDSVDEPPDIVVDDDFEI